MSLEINLANSIKEVKGYIEQEQLIDWKKFVIRDYLWYNGEHVDKVTSLLKEFKDHPDSIESVALKFNKLDMIEEEKEIIKDNIKKFSTYGEKFCSIIDAIQSNKIRATQVNDPPMNDNNNITNTKSKTR